MTYSKPEIIAQNNAAGSYAAGCPMKKDRGEDFYNGSTSATGCAYCERIK